MVSRVKQVSVRDAAHLVLANGVVPLHPQDAVLTVRRGTRRQWTPTCPGEMTPSHGSELTEADDGRTEINPSPSPRSGLSGAACPSIRSAL